MGIVHVPGNVREIGYGTHAGTTLTTSYVTHATVTGESRGGECKALFGLTGGNGNSGGNRTLSVQVTCDGSAITPASTTWLSIYVATLTTYIPYTFEMASTPAAGSHTWNLQILASAGSAVVVADNYIQILEKLPY